MIRQKPYRLLTIAEGSAQLALGPAGDATGVEGDGEAAGEYGLIQAPQTGWRAESVASPRAAWWLERKAMSMCPLKPG
jgi:hypothetical protein